MKKIELLAPGGDIESIKAAIVAGADAIYCGLNHFNARNRATNIELGDLDGILDLAHANRCKIFLTINIIIIESEFKALISLLNKLVNTDIDGVIVQDLGLFYLLLHYFPQLEVHASTQVTTHNKGQIQFLNLLNVTRVNLSRELNINEIKAMVTVGHRHGIESEVFVHGSYCLCFSGICYLSSVLKGRSGNRGRCSQQCRDQYCTTAVGNDFPLNLKDNSAFNDLDLLTAAGVDSFKIEGRMKKFHYVYTVVKSWRRLLDQFYATGQHHSSDTSIYRVFNRTFSDGFLQGAIGQEMFIDNPRDSSARYFSQQLGNSEGEDLSTAKRELYAARTVIMNDVRAKIDQLKPVTQVLPLKDGAKKMVALPALNKQQRHKQTAKLSVIISSIDQLCLCNATNAEFYYQLPGCIENGVDEFVDLFVENTQLMPWFPSILIGEHYRNAVELLERLQPQCIVTNNSGIAYEAYKKGVAWIAGPYMNSINSYTLMCLKEKFDCRGAFISNELSRDQIENIAVPENFDLYFSLYHPILLLSSRQCLHYQLEGCEKKVMDDDCIHHCARTSTLTTIKNIPLVVEKSRGNYHRLFHHKHLLNTQIVSDLPNKFSHFVIDLSAIKTQTSVAVDHTSLIESFENLLCGKVGAKAELERVLQHVTNKQYGKGI